MQWQRSYCLPPSSRCVLRDSQNECFDTRLFRAGDKIIGASSGEHTRERLVDHGAHMMTMRSKECGATASMESTRRMVSQGRADMGG